MKKLTQKLVLSVITMALVVVALGTSTFAWFTLQNSATVQSFNGTVTSGEGIEISLGQLTSVGTGIETQSINYETETDWYTALPSTIINGFITSKYNGGFEFVNVTSPNGLTFKEVDGTTDASAGAYIEFNLYFRSRTASLPITWNMADLSGTPTTWVVNSPVFKHADGQYYGIGTAPLGAPVYPSMKVATWPAARISVAGNNVTTPVLVFQEPSNANGANTDVSNSTAMPDTSYANGAEFGAAAYEKANGVVRTYESPTLPDAVVSLDNSVTILTLGSSVSPNTEYYVGSVTVRVWIEGWDADTYDSIFETILAATIGFTETVTP